MSDIFQEVDEEVRREKLQQLWERHSNLIIAVALLVVLAVGGWRGYEYWENQKAAEAAPDDPDVLGTAARAFAEQATLEARKAVTAGEKARSQPGSAGEELKAAARTCAVRLLEVAPMAGAMRFEMLSDPKVQMMLTPDLQVWSANGAFDPQGAAAATNLDSLSFGLQFTAVRARIFQ